jgi:hypothetical protein
MAGALRKVSLNYNWTIKRAQNDLYHNIITPQRPQPQPQPTSPSFPDTKLVDFSVLPWDVSVRFRLVMVGVISEKNTDSRIAFDGNSRTIMRNFANILSVLSSFYSAGP